MSNTEMFTVEQEYWECEAPDGIHLFPITGYTPGGAMQSLSQTDEGVSPADVMPDEWAECQNGCGDGFVRIEELTYCSGGYVCDNCGPCSHRECHWED